jgi:hypothetical protein
MDGMIVGVDVRDGFREGVRDDRILVVVVGVLDFLFVLVLVQEVVLLFVLLFVFIFVFLVDEGDTFGITRGWSPSNETGVI